jgi:hypothetical protein
MMGWWFTVRLHPNMGSNTLADQDRPLLASWETGVSGLRWIEELVAQRVAQKTHAGGYPNRYLVPAAPVLRQLQQNMQTPASPPKTSSDWRDGKFVPAAINACPVDAQLEIEAWDQS